MLKMEMIWATNEPNITRKVNEFLEQDLRIISISSFPQGTSGIYTQIIYEVGSNGSKMVKQTKQPYIEIDSLDTQREI